MASSPSAAGRPGDPTGTEVEPLLNGDDYGRAPRGAGSSTPPRSPAGDGSDRRLAGPDQQDIYDFDLIIRIGAAMFSFFIMGLLVSIGVLIPYLEAHYDLSDTLVSLVFMTQPAGYLIAASLNSSIHMRFGQRGIAIIGPSCQLIYALVAAFHPSYPAYLVFSTLGGVGSGLHDASWNAWTGGMEKNRNTIQGFMHGSFSTGAALGPFIAGTMLSVGKLPWYTWFYVLSAFCLVELVSSIYAFRHQDARRYHAEKHTKAGLSTHSEHNAWAIIGHAATWICGAYFLSYVGIETSITGWIVVFMTRVRHATTYLSSICSSLFNIGMALGRVGLGVLTDKLGVRLAVIMYLSMATLLQCLFAIIQVPAASAILITLIGVFLGPMFPSGVVMITGLLPSNLHVDALAAVVTVGELGGALLPVGLGAISDRVGIGAFQYIIIAQLVVTLLIWMCFPGLPPSTVLVDDSAACDEEEG